MRYIFLTLFTLVVITLQAQNLLTIREVFNFNVGDEYHYKNIYNNSLPNAERASIIEKYHSSGNDTVYYRIAYDNYSTEYVSESAPYLEYSFTKDTILINYSNLDSSILYFNAYHRYDSLVLQLDTFLYDTIVEYDNDLCNISLSGYKLLTGAVDFEPNIETYKYGEGVGLVYHDFIYGGHPESSIPKILFYYKKENFTCGNPDMTTYIESAELNEYYKVYPNPVKENLNIVGEPNSKVNYTLKIYSLDGILLKSEIVNENHYSINLNTAIPGIYILQIVKDNETVFKKIVKE